MNRFSRVMLRSTALVALMVGSTVTAAETIDIYKQTGCECCAKWAEHLRSNGIDTRVHETDELHKIKAKFGVPDEVASCHTGKVGNYFIEGHVPADLVQKLLKERPNARGLAGHLAWKALIKSIMPFYSSNQQATIPFTPDGRSARTTFHPRS